MPEGHTLHRLAGVLDRTFAGTVVRANSPQGRFVEGAARLDGRRCERAEAWGKHLFVTFEDDLILNVHLGLIGVFDVLRATSLLRSARSGCGWSTTPTLPTCVP